MSTRPKRKAAASKPQYVDPGSGIDLDDMAMDYDSESSLTSLGSDSNSDEEIDEMFTAKTEQPSSKRPSSSKGRKKQTKKVDEPPSKALSSSKRPSKRRKTEKNEPLSTTDAVSAVSAAAFEALPAGLSKQQGKLSLLPTMPLDILFAIFSFLLPQDILSLSRTTRTFRDALMTRQATTVWKAARKRICAPDCPEIISEPRWASLLHGHVCQSCGTNNVHYVVFTLLRRSCKACRSLHLLSPLKLRKQFPRIDSTALDLLPYHMKATKKHYWDSELKGILAQIATLKSNIKKKVPGAQQALDDFKNTRKASIDSLAELRDEYAKFLMTRSTNRWEEEVDLGRKRLQSIQARFKQLGYEDDDLACLKYSSVCNRHAELTERAWLQLRKEVEKELIEHRLSRLEKAQSSIRRDRRKLIEIGYNKYLQTIPTSQWKHLPRVLDISFFEPFAKLVTADADLTVTLKDFEEPFKQLPQLLQDHDKKLKVRLIESLPRPKKGKSRSSNLEAQLELAQSVFQCQDHGCIFGSLIGWDSLSSHHCRDVEEGLDKAACVYGYNKPLSYDERGAAIAKSIIEMAGLDHSTATADDMDELDLRFACSRRHCWIQRPAPNMVNGYQWREIISHAASHQRYSRSLQPIHVFLLSEIEALDIKAQEAAHELWKKPSWICGHCPTYTPNNRQEKSIVEDHLKAEHSIEIPKDGQDLFFFERGPLLFNPHPQVAAVRPEPEETTVPVKTSEPKEQTDDTFICLRCADSRSKLTRNKGYTLEAVQAHLLSKHQVPSPNLEIDYKEKS